MPNKSTSNLRVMICYSHDDKFATAKLEQLIELGGWYPVRDEYDLPIGMELHAGMRLMVESSRVVLFLGSHPSVLSPNCLEELEYARVLKKPILPAMLQKSAHSNMPAWLSTMKYADLSEHPIEEAAVQIVGSLYQLIL